MIILFTMISLLAGLAYGIFGFDVPAVSLILQNTDGVLYALMFFVGISIGMHRGILSKIREYHIKIFIIPAGIIAGSIVGGIICSLLLKIPVGQGTAIASGMGWYSLAGAAISELGGAKLGSIAFMSNLMREIGSFFLIPFIAIKLNDLTCIAPAGATSEDTTLPVMLKYTNEETVVLSVLNGMLCSFAVPVLISVFAG